MVQKLFKPLPKKYNYDGSPAPDITKLYTETIPYEASELIFKSDGLKCEDRYQFSLSSKDNRQLYKNNVDFHVEKCEEEEIAGVKKLLNQMILLAADKKTYFATDYNYISFYDDAWSLNGYGTNVTIWFRPDIERIVVRARLVVEEDETIVHEHYHYNDVSRLYEILVKPLTRPFEAVAAEMVIQLPDDSEYVEYSDYLYRRPHRLDGRDRLKRIENLKKILLVISGIEKGLKNAAGYMRTNIFRFLRQANMIL